MFSGKSSLRKAEPKAAAPINAELQDYLKKYTDGGAGEEGKKKKKKKPKTAPAGGVQIVDTDVSGFASTRSPTKARKMALGSEDEGDEGGWVGRSIAATDSPRLDPQPAHAASHHMRSLQKDPLLRTPRRQSPMPSSWNW